MDKLKTIDTFVHIARTGSLTKAAGELNISRALASSHLAQLEDHLGVRLINRTTRRLSLTEIGTEYLRFAKRTLDSFDEEAAVISQWHSSPRGHLRVLSSTSFANFCLSPIIPNFLEQNAEIRISLLVTETHLTGVDLIDRGFDLAFTMHRPSDSGIVCTRIGEVRWLPWAARSYLKKHGTPLKPQDLAHHNCIVHRSVAPDGIWRLSSGRRTISAKVQGTFMTNTVVPIVSMVTCGIGIGLLPTYCVEQEIARGTITRVLDRYSGPSKAVYAIYPHARYLPKKVRAFIDYAKSTLKINR